MKLGLWGFVRKLVFLFDAESVHRRFAGWLAFFGASVPGRAFLRLVSGTNLKRDYHPVVIAGMVPESDRARGGIR